MQAAHGKAHGTQERKNRKGIASGRAGSEKIRGTQDQKAAPTRGLNPTEKPSPLRGVSGRFEKKKPTHQSRNQHAELVQGVTHDRETNGPQQADDRAQQPVPGQEHPLPTFLAIHCAFRFRSAEASVLSHRRFFLGGLKHKRISGCLTVR